MSAEYDVRNLVILGAVAGGLYLWINNKPRTEPGLPPKSVIAKHTSTTTDPAGKPGTTAISLTVDPILPTTKNPSLVDPQNAGARKPKFEFPLNADEIYSPYDFYYSAQYRTALPDSLMINHTGLTKKFWEQQKLLGQAFGRELELEQKKQILSKSVYEAKMAEQMQEIQRLKMGYQQALDALKRAYTNGEDKLRIIK